MKKNSLLVSICFFVFAISFAQKKSSLSYTPSESNIRERENFRDKKFGLFIHWGIYSVISDGEWVMYNRHMSYDNYKRTAELFNPQDFDAKAWVKMAKDAGMKYITITSRHHDGFSMFKTKASAYNVVDATPYRKDPLMDLAVEAKKEGIALHLYYSLLDWGRADYGFGKKIVNGKPEGTDWNSYIAFMKTQLTELITNYPDIKAIWFDGHWERPNVNWHYDELYSLIHRLNPAILIGNNHHMSPSVGEDFQMFERDLPGENKMGYRKTDKVTTLPLETCQTMNDSWGFNIGDKNYKSTKQLIQMLVNAAGRNANLLLNVGPMPSGKIQQAFVDTLAKIGNWTKVYGTTIFGTRGNIVPPQSWGVVTSKAKTFYAHVLIPPVQDFIFIPITNHQVKSVVLFADNTALKFKQEPKGVSIYTDNVQLNDIDTIIQLTMK